MVIENIILEELLKIKEINLLLLESLNKTPELLTNKDTLMLRKHLEEQEKLSLKQFENIEGIKNILFSTHFKSLSQFISSTNNTYLIEEYKDFKDILYKIVIKNNLNKQLLEDCQRITNTRLNLLIGRKQEPTNYNFSAQNINTHLLNKLKK